MFFYITCIFLFILFFNIGLTRSQISSDLDSSERDIAVGERVIVAGQRKGTVQFVGETKFAPGAYDITRTYTKL